VHCGGLHAKMFELKEIPELPFGSSKCKGKRIDGENRQVLGDAFLVRIPYTGPCLDRVRIVSGNCDYVKSYSEKG
jgi:hypothetical protein